MYIYIYIYTSFNPSTAWWIPLNYNQFIFSAQKKGFSAQNPRSPAFISCKGQAHEHGEKEEGQDTCRENHAKIIGILYGI